MSAAEYLVIASQSPGTRDLTFVLDEQDVDLPKSLPWQLSDEFGRRPGFKGLSTTGSVIDGLLINPTYERAESAANELLNRCNDAGTVAILSFIGHGRMLIPNRLQAPRHVALLSDSLPDSVVPGRETNTWELARQIAERLPSLRSLHGLIVIFDACEAAACLPEITRWTDPDNQVPSVWIGASDLEAAYDGHLTREVIKILRHGIPSAIHPSRASMPRILASDAYLVIRERLPAQKPMIAGYITNHPQLHLGANAALSGRDSESALPAYERSKFRHLLQEPLVEQYFADAVATIKSNRLCKVVAKAGLGKSTLAALARSDQMNTLPILLASASAFCDRDTSVQQAALSLEAQLTRLSGYQRATWLAELDRTPEWSSLDAWQRLVAEPLRRFGSPIRLIIDAVDEIESAAEQFSLLQHLEVMADDEDFTHVSIVVTARALPSSLANWTLVELPQIQASQLKQYLDQRHVSASLEVDYQEMNWTTARAREAATSAPGGIRSLERTLSLALAEIGSPACRLIEFLSSTVGTIAIPRRVALDAIDLFPPEDEPGPHVAQLELDLGRLEQLGLIYRDRLGELSETFAIAHDSIAQQLSAAVEDAASGHRSLVHAIHASMAEPAVADYASRHLVHHLSRGQVLHDYSYSALHFVQDQSGSVRNLVWPLAHDGRSVLRQWAAKEPVWARAEPRQRSLLAAVLAADDVRVPSVHNVECSWARWSVAYDDLVREPVTAWCIADSSSAAPIVAATNGCLLVIDPSVGWTSASRYDFPHEVRHLAARRDAESIEIAAYCADGRLYAGAIEDELTSVSIEGEVSRVGIDRFDNLLVSAAGSGGVKIWELRNRMGAAELVANSAVAFPPHANSFGYVEMDGLALFVGGDRGVEILRMDGSEAVEPPEVGFAVRHLAVANGGHSLLVAGKSDFEFHDFDSSSGKWRKNRSFGLRSAAVGCAMSPDGLSAVITTRTVIHALRRDAVDSEWDVVSRGMSEGFGGVALDPMSLTPIVSGPNGISGWLGAYADIGHDNLGFVASSRVRHRGSHAIVVETIGGLQALSGASGRSLEMPGLSSLTHPPKQHPEDPSVFLFTTKSGWHAGKPGGASSVRLGFGHTAEWFDTWNALLANSSEVSKISIHSGVASARTKLGWNPRILQCSSIGVLAGGERLSLLDLGDIREVWSRPVPERVHSLLVDPDGADTAIWVGSGSGLTRHESSQGAVVSEYGIGPVFSLAIAGGTLFVGCSSSIRLYAAGSGNPIGEYITGSPVRSLYASAATGENSRKYTVVLVTDDGAARVYLPDTRA